MPNWTDVTVNLKAPEEKKNLVKEFIKKFEENDFEAFIPIPENIKDVNEQVDFAYKNWGTKGIDPESLGTGEDFICFMSAWEPPYAFFINVSKKYPDITFVLEWIYDGENEMHTTVIQNGKEIHYEKALFIISDHIHEEDEKKLKELKSKFIKIFDETGKAIIDDEEITDRQMLLNTLERVLY